MTQKALHKKHDIKSIAQKALHKLHDKKAWHNVNVNF